MNVNDLVRRADEILAMADGVLATRRADEYREWVGEGPFAAFRTASLSFFANVFGRDHPYYTDFAQRVTEPKPARVRIGVGIVSAAKGELAGGWIRTARGLISAEIFGDFLEMAEHLASEHYKDAAAVIAGSSLEEHLRQLAVSAGVTTTTITKGGDVVPKKADALNADLAGAGAYSKLDLKSITAWLDLRNKAAHGRYTEYDEAQVRLMIEGIRQLIARVPA